MNKMRSNIMGFLLLILVISLVACGGGGGAGSPGSSGSIPSVITAIVVPGSGLAKQDGAEGATVDAYRSECTQGTYEGSEEPFRHHLAELTLIGTPISTDDAVTKDDLIFENYKVEFYPQTLGAPPIAEFHGVFQSLVLPNTAVEVITTVILVDIDRKLQFVKDMSSGAFSTDTTSPLYVAKYTFQGKDIYGNAFTVVSQTSFFMGDYDSCGPVTPATPAGG